MYEDSALTVQFTDISQYVDSYWHWDFGDGDSSLIPNPIHTYPQAGFYTVCLTAGDSCTTDTWCKEIAVTSSGIENIQTDETRFSVHPNPFKNSTMFSFILSEESHVLLQIYNCTGQKVATLFDNTAEAGIKHTVDFNTEKLAEGMYIAVLKSDKHNKVIKLSIVK